jgi:iron complex transport system permease protein
MSAAAAGARGQAGGARLGVPGPVALAVGIGALVLASAASLALGTVPIPLDRTLSALTAYDGSPEHVIVVESRLPRTFIAAAVGAAFGVAGALMQAVSRNALADPSILGVSWGAAAAAVGAQLLLEVGSMTALLLVALAGAAVAGLLVVGLAAAHRGGLTPERLVVAGAAVSALLAALVQGLLVLDRESLEAARRWLAGSVAGQDTDVLVAAGPYLTLGFALAWRLARPLTTLGLGESVARGLGQRTGRVKVVTAVAVVLLAGSAVAMAGPIVLVGLAVPHVARFLVGHDLRRALPACALLGAVLVLMADVAARMVLAPEELPVGVMAALVGTPVFLHVARRGAGLR